MSASPIKLLTAEEVRMLPTPVYLVEPILPAACFAVLYGEPKVGKTFIALDLALAVGTGCAWLDRPVLHGPVVYVVGEGVRGIPQRLDAWTQVHGYDGDLGVRFLNGPVQLANPGSVTSLLTAITTQLEAAPKFIVLDTLARCFVGGDENSAKDVGKLVAGVDRIRHQTDATVLLVHHPGWDGQHERGSNALRGAADLVLRAYVSKKDHRLYLSTETTKDAEIPDPIALRLDVVELSGGDTSCVPQAADAPAPEKLPPKHAHALKLLTCAGGLTLTEWLQMTDFPKTTFHRIRRDLVTWGRVEPPGSTGGKYIAPPKEPPDAG